MKKYIESIVSICGLIAIVFSVYFYIDSRYALAGTVALLSDRLEIKILDDKEKNLRQRIWDYEDRYEDERKMPDIAKKEYRELKEEKEKISDKLKQLDTGSTDR